MRAAKIFINSFHFRCTSGKRKQQAVQPLQETFQLNFFNISTLDIHEIDVELIVNRMIVEIRSGTHSSLSHREASLQMQKKKIIDAADRHRQYQIVNVNNIFEYEVEDANAQYEVTDSRKILINVTFILYFRSESKARNGR